MYEDSPTQSLGTPLPTISEREEGPTSTFQQNILDRFNFVKIDSEGSSSFDSDVDPCKLLSVPATGKFLFETQNERDIRGSKGIFKGELIKEKSGKEETGLGSARTMKTVYSSSMPSEDEEPVKREEMREEKQPESKGLTKIIQVEKDLEEAGGYKIDFGKELNGSFDEELFEGDPPPIPEAEIIRPKETALRNFFRLFWEDQASLSYLCCSVSPNALMVIMLVFFLVRSSVFLIVFNLFYAQRTSPELGIVLNTYAILFLLFPPFGSILFFGKVSGNISLNRILLSLDGVMGIVLAIYLIIFVTYHLGRFLVPEGYSDFQIFADRVGHEPFLVLGMLLPWLYHDLIFVSFFFLYDTKKGKREVDLEGSRKINLS